MDCSLCGNIIKRHSKKILGGCICKDCVDLLPKSISNNLTKYSEENLKTIVDYMKKIDKKVFLPTASFGSLHIDEIHGLFAIEEKLKDNFNPEELTDIFYCLSLKDVGLSPTNPVVDRTNTVYCDFELHCWFEYPECSFTVPVKKKVKCPTKRKNKTELSYEMPGDYLIFLQMFDQMISVTRKKYSEQMESNFISEYKLNLFKAETMFILAEGYQMDDVERQKSILMKAFFNQKEYVNLIEQAYSYLRFHLLQEGKNE